MTLLRDESSSWWRCPQTPGIYRIPARMTDSGGRSLDLRSFRPLSRRSGCVPAVPYPPLRSFQSGLPQPRRAMIFQRTATTPLTSCLTPGVQFSLTPRPYALVCLIAAGISISFAQPRTGPAAAAVWGELKQWHKVTLTLDGPQASESSNDPNPFLDPEGYKAHVDLCERAFYYKMDWAKRAK